MVFSLHEPVRPHARSPASFGGELVEGRQLDAAGFEPLQRLVAACHRHDDGGGRVFRVDRGRGNDAEPDHSIAGGDLHPGHARGVAALRADQCGSEAQQLSLTGDEGQLVVVVGGDLRADHEITGCLGVRVFRPDDLPFVAVERILRIHPLDPPGGGPHGDDGVQRHQRDELLALLQAQEVLDLGSLGERRTP